MTGKQIKHLILTGEGYRIEFKQALDKSLIDEVCAFANSSGGHILMGVADDGTVEGIDTSNRTRSKIQDVLNKLEPKLNTTIEVKENLIVIHVPEGQEKPYGCSRGFFIRIGPNSQKMTRNEIIKLFKKEGRVRFEELINEKANFTQDFDSKAFKHFLKLSGISSTIKPETLLQNLDCLTSDKEFTNLGVLFFAKDIDFIMNYALVDCILFRGTDKVKILDRKQYKGNIIDNIEDALAFVHRHTNTEYVITGKPRREEIPDYPETALREAIVNAVCHRDYFIREVPVVVEVFADRVEIQNPGGLPKGFDPKKFGTQSFPRNLLIASMLHRANYIEKAGTGISRIKETIANHKKKVTLDIEYSDDSIFYNIIFRKEDLAKATQKTTQKTTQKILDLINKNPYITRQELSREIGNITPDGIKYHLEQLKKQGVLKRVGADKGGHWKVIKK
ncbi:MAG: helix-turn-helix domain-containing protein [Bdellovibrionales bacterium]|nr:helix-turn-helix domain-containing protein [Bdellovibrionales bacterium]